QVTVRRELTVRLPGGNLVYKRARFVPLLDERRRFGERADQGIGVGAQIAPPSMPRPARIHDQPVAIEREALDKPRTVAVGVEPFLELRPEVLDGILRQPPIACHQLRQTGHGADLGTGAAHADPALIAVPAPSHLRHSCSSTIGCPSIAASRTIARSMRVSAK